MSAGNAASEDETVDDAGSRTASDGATPGRARLLALLLAGVLIPGIARWWLGTLGHDRLGVAVFVVGYALALALVWRGWLSEVEFTGPDS